MDFFFSITIIGIALIFIAYSNVKYGRDLTSINVFNIKIINKYLCYIQSEILERIKFKDGIIMMACGLLGLFFYESLGFVIFCFTILIIVLYLITLFINLYKYVK